MSTMTCENCDAPHGPDDMFCENCGYDFITGSLPVDEHGSPGSPAPSGGTAPPSAPSVLDPPSPAAGSGQGPGPDPGGAAPPVPRVRITVSVDRAYFDAVVNDGEIDFPDPVPADVELELTGAELHIGRTSDSRAIHPDVDVAELTGDQAVSSRHAVLRVADDGAYTIVDVGSTNGTFLDAIDADAIVQGVPIEVKPGVPIYLGAWTRLVIAE